DYENVKQKREMNLADKFAKQSFENVKHQMNEPRFKQLSKEKQIKVIDDAKTRFKNEATDFINAVNKKKCDKIFSGLLHSQNKKYRAWFTELTGIKLPSTQKGTKQTLIKYVGMGKYSKYLEAGKAEKEKQHNKYLLENALSEIQKPHKIKYNGKTYNNVKEFIDVCLKTSNYKVEKTKPGIKPIYRIIFKDDEYMPMAGKNERIYIDHILSGRSIKKSIRYLFKSHVKAHTRATKTGKIVRVKDYENRIKEKKIKYIMKSWSSNLQRKYAGSRWIRISDESSPSHGRAILIVPHKDGTATVAWAPHHSGLTHKVLQAKKEGKKDTEEKKPEKEKPEMNEEERLNAMERKKEIERKQKEIKTEMHEKIRSKLGIETEVTREEKSKIERDISKIADKRERNIERLKQFNRIKTERDKAIDEVIGEAKEAMLGSDRDVTDMPVEKKQLREIIKENAEEFLKYHYQIKAYKREKSVLSKILKQGGKYKGGTDVVEIKPMSADEIRQVLTDEKAVEMEIEDHYRLIINTRGGIDKNGEEIVGKGTGSETIAQNIRKGGFEAMTGITGEATGSSIIDMDRYKTLGSGNAAVLMNYYFENSMGKEGYTKEISGLKNYIEKEGQKIAKQGMDNGDKYLNRAQRIKEFGKGEDALFGDRVQANATALQYIQRAYENYGQAEGSLNQMAELLYQFENKKRNIEYNSNSRQKLNSIRDKLRLNKSDAYITRLDNGYKMVIRPSVFEKLIKEKPVIAKEYGAVSVADIKAGKANTDNYLPEGLRPYLPPDKNGVSQKIVLAPHQQAAARLVVKEKRVYLNHEAGTGKSLSYISSIAAIKEKTGKMPKTVISMPKKLMPNFSDEVKKFSDFNVVIVDSTNKATREKLYNGDPNTIILVNKEKYLFDHDIIKNAGFDMMIVDEAHKSTQREGRGTSGMSKGLSDLASNMEYFIAGTGSPTPNDLSELYFYLKTIDPEKYSNQKQFMEKYKNLHRGAGLKDKLAEVLHKEIDDRVFTVKKDLQHTFNQHIHNAKLSESQKLQYKKVMTDYRSKKIDVLQRDQKLNRILNSSLRPHSI
ncbi:MAG TPA: hypothetical protein DHW42_11575, partial [Candidatus Marinimicrobia bacterium]|nr:hypothetical protein [Candidatus Neomarinimicrobiota bacterium]